MVSSWTCFTSHLYNAHWSLWLLLCKWPWNAQAIHELHLSICRLEILELLNERKILATMLDMLVSFLSSICFWHMLESHHTSCLMKWSWRILLCMSKGSSFMIGRALTSVFWGIVADRYGRKPVILLGTLAVWVISTFQVHVLTIKVGFLCSKNIMFTLSWLSWLLVGLRVIFNTLFGLSVNFWMAIITRFLLGSLNGLLGPIKVGFCSIFIKISLG